jgi:hypothetical protein
LAGVSAFCILPSVFTFPVALGGFGWVCPRQRGFGPVAHIFLALDPRLSALSFGNPFIFHVFGVFRGLDFRSGVQWIAARFHLGNRKSLNAKLYRGKKTDENRHK